MFALNPGIWSHNWLSKSLSRRREPRRGTSTCMLLQADAVECNAQSCTIYGPWTVYKKQCSLSEWGTEDGWESFQSRKPSFRIICAMMKIFPPWRKMAGSTTGHLYSNQKRRGWDSCHNYSFSSSASCGMFTLLSIKSVSKRVWNCANFLLKISARMEEILTSISSIRAPILHHFTMLFFFFITYVYSQNIQSFCSVLMIKKLVSPWIGAFLNMLYIIYNTRSDMVAETTLIFLNPLKLPTSPLEKKWPAFIVLP